MVSVVRMLVRATGLALIVLGLLFWTGRALTLVPIHMALGLLLVVSLWVLAVWAARAGAPAGLVAAAVVWSLVMPALGLAQTRLLPGGAHWVVQAIHLLVGLGALGLADRLAARIPPARTPGLIPPAL